MRKISHGIVVRAAGLVGLLFLAGCVSDHPGSSSLAYVDIGSHGVEAVRAETVRVLADENYRLVDETGGVLRFEREATQRDQVMYGRYGEHLAMRVVVTIEPRRQGGSLVRADAFVLRDRTAEPVLRLARRPYQDLLNRVKASLVNTVKND